jgi:gas vesicle protein
MYYDDEARRFNFLSGLLLGVVLGTGVALLAGPARSRAPQPIRRTARRARRATRRTTAHVREGVAGGAEGAIDRLRAATRRER